jgi:hypothetical protein
MLKKLVDISLGKLGQTTNSGLPSNLTSDIIKGRNKSVIKKSVRRKSIMPELNEENYQTL